MAEVMAAELSASAPERARKIVHAVHGRLKEGETQAAIATATGLSPATVNRLLNEHLEGLALLLTQLGLKVVPTEFRCVDPEAFAFMSSRLERVMREQPKLIWDAE